MYTVDDVSNLCGPVYGGRSPMSRDVLSGVSAPLYGSDRAM